MLLAQAFLSAVPSAEGIEASSGHHTHIKRPSWLWLKPAAVHGTWCKPKAQASGAWDRTHENRNLPAKGLNLLRETRLPQRLFRYAGDCRTRPEGARGNQRAGRCRLSTRSTEGPRPPDPGAGDQTLRS